MAERAPREKKPLEDEDEGEPELAHKAKAPEAEGESLKYSLLGPSLTKAGQENVDQSKVSEIIYNVSKGSKFFNREQEKDKILTAKIEQILARKRALEKVDLGRELRAADNLIAQLELSRDLSQSIVHLDCDAFYAAVEQLDRPELKDKPFAVGMGVLTTCNYVARRSGCRSGMAAFVAKKLCPDLALGLSYSPTHVNAEEVAIQVLLPLNFKKYTAKASEVRAILATYDPRFESASIDEAYMNLTEYCKTHQLDPADAVAQMRQEIHDKTKITVSAGIAANTKLAKICSNMNKPNGQYVLPSERTAIMRFMHDLPCRKVNGIGRVLERELASIGLQTCGDIYPNRKFLLRLFGEKTFDFLLGCFLGLGRTSVQPAEEYERKSVGTERTFRDMADPKTLREQLRQTAEELEKDLARNEVKGRVLCLKIKLHSYEVFTRQVVLPKAVCQADDLEKFALPMLAKLEQEIPSMTLRLMGLRCTRLVSTKKPDTLAFFGLRSRKGSEETVVASSAKRKAAEMEEEWEQWPEEEFAEDGHLALERHEFPQEGEEARTGRGEKEEQEKEKEEEKQEGAETTELEEEWDCPICNRPQQADEKQFNSHIDMCLSRQTIREVVREGSERQQELGGGARPATPTAPTEPRRPREKKRGRPSAAPDPKQRRIYFGT